MSFPARTLRWLTAVLLPVLAGLSAVAQAQSPEERGLAIAVEAKRRDSGFGDYTVEMRMILRDASGNTSERRLRASNLEVQGDGDKSLLVFDQPKDVAGSALLTWAHRGSSDDRWLFLPEVRRVKRIQSSNQSGAFMGSEFSYEDLASVEVEKYRYRFVSEGAHGGQPAFVYERIPLEKNSGYSRQVVTLDQAEYRLQKIEFYDLRNSLLKTLTASGYQRYAGRFWRPEQFEMVNAQTGRGTTLRFSNYRFGAGLVAADFEPKRLESAP